jgi:predicted GNAT family acetyltransferase
MTAPEFRGRGYAKAVTGAVTSDLLGFCDDVVLNVRADNPPALNAYRRIGYIEHVRYEERLSRRQGSLLGEIAAALRRRLIPGDAP